MNDLFGNALSKAPEGQRRVLYDNDKRKVILIGYMPGRKCKECANFFRAGGHSKVYRRCALYPKKFWKANWDACKEFKLEDIT